MRRLLVAIAMFFVSTGAWATASPDGSSMPFIDSNGDSWLLEQNSPDDQVYKNGSYYYASGNTLIYYGGTIYIHNSYDQWYGILPNLAGIWTRVPEDPRVSSFSGRWFSYYSPWNTLIDSIYSYTVVNDYDTGPLVSSSKPTSWNFNKTTYTPTLTEATAGAPTYAWPTAYINSGTGSWAMPAFPLMANEWTAANYAYNNSDTDALQCVYSDDQQVFYGFVYFQATPHGSATYTATPSAGSLTLAGLMVNPLNGMGWNGGTLPGASGSGRTPCAGVIRSSEASGTINHAIAVEFSSNTGTNAGIQCTSYVWPATSSDGHQSSNCIKEGQLVQVDPSLTDTYLTGTLGFAIADLPLIHAMQKYGMYDVDSTGNANLMVTQFFGYGAGSNPYPSFSSGSTWLGLLPHMRVLSVTQMTASGNPALDALSSVCPSYLTKSGAC